MATEKLEIGPALSSDLIRIAVAYNDALDQCTRTQGSNIDEVMEFFDEDATRLTVGQDRLSANLRILLVKEGKIKRLIVVVDTEEDNRLKPSAP